MQVGRGPPRLVALDQRVGEDPHGVALDLAADTHWSQEGCRLAFGEIMRAMGAVPPADLAGRPFDMQVGRGPPRLVALDQRVGEDPHGVALDLADPHSQEGCRLAFGEIMRAMGAVPPADLAGRPFHDHDP
jgi:hypothetical protein